MHDGDFNSSPVMERTEAPSFSRASMIVRSESVRCLPFVMLILASVKKALDYFSRDDITVVNSVMADILSALKVSDANKEKIVSYMDKSFQTARENLGDGRMFDLLWSLIHTAESTTDIMQFVSHISDTLYQIAKFNYSEDNPSKYIPEIEYLTKENK